MWLKSRVWWFKFPVIIARCKNQQNNVNTLFLCCSFVSTTCLSTLTLWVWTPFRLGVLDTTLCDIVCQWIAPGRWFSPGTLVYSTNKTDRQVIAEILLKVALNTINPTLYQQHIIKTGWKINDCISIFHVLAYLLLKFKV